MFTSAWFPPLDPAATHKPLLFCVPFAGGGAGIFKTWPAAMPHLQVVPVQLPGRERRLREPAYDRMDALVDDLFADMRPLLDRPWSVFGHSMGAGIAYEVARAATAEGKPPKHLFVSARRAPGEPPTHPPLFALPDDAMVAETERLYGPMPAAVRRYPALLKAMLPTMRADFKLLDTWKAPTDQALTCPVTAYGGADDPAHAPPALDAWAKVTSGPFRKQIFPGGHFRYVRDDHDARDDVKTTLDAG